MICDHAQDLRDPVIHICRVLALSYFYYAPCETWCHISIDLVDYAANSAHHSDIVFGIVMLVLLLFVLQLVIL